MRTLFNGILLMGIGTIAATGQTSPPRWPTHDPHTPGYVEAKELPDGANAPADSDGNFILGPTHKPTPEIALEGSPLGAIVEFTMSSAESKIAKAVRRIARRTLVRRAPDPRPSNAA